MKIRFFFPPAAMAIILGGILSCDLINTKRRSELIWSKDFSVIGSQSSPRTTDLNKDGTLDI
ncbi:MAG: hypothetical protein ICV66_12070, partial [Chitinophagaceae bacterium]|nr:hypothetical protein [Chitinophagaceae bacterium]